MHPFHYKGIDSRGKNVSGRLVANDEPNLEEKLRGQGIWLVEARPETEEPKKALRASQRQGGGAGGGSRRELINFCTLMSFLCKVGIPVVQAVDIAAQDTDHEGFRDTLTEMKRDVESGQQLAEAMERHPGVFQKQFVNLIRAGEQSGSIPESFSELKRYLEWQEQVAADVKQATIYPAFVLLATAGAMKTAQEVRLGYSTNRLWLRSVAMLASNLYLRSQMRAVSLFTALSCRGYSGELRVLVDRAPWSATRVMGILCVHVLVGVWGVATRTWGWV